MARIVKLSRINPERVAPADAVHRAAIRDQDKDIALADAPAGPVEDRNAALKRAGTKDR